jgi:hypothetical protein
MFDPQRYYNMDRDEIERYNSCQSDPKKRLHLEMGPAPYDGDPDSAKIVLLLNNPTFTSDSVPEDHTYKFDGWPLAGLHPSVREKFRKWYYDGPLNYLLKVKKYPAKLVSQRVAIIQVSPWASQKFDLAFELPSRQAQVAIARQALERGAILIVGRSVKFWRSALDNPSNIYVAVPPINPRISPSQLVGFSQEDFDARFSPCFQASNLGE